MASVRELIQFLAKIDETSLGIKAADPAAELEVR